MMRHIFRPSAKLFLSVFLAVVVACFSVSAFAATNTVAGCQPEEKAAMAAKATALVAYDNAVTSELMVQPPSVLTLTCFDQQAAVYGVNGGAIFSTVGTGGDLRGKTGPNTMLNAIMPVTPATGNLPNPAFNCTAIGNLWKTIITEGIETGVAGPYTPAGTGVPYATFNDLMTDAVPAGAGTGFTTAWNAAVNPPAATAPILGAAPNALLSTAYTTYATNAGLYNVANTNDNADNNPPAELQFMPTPGVWNCSGTVNPATGAMTQTAASAVAQYAINGVACP